MANVRTALSKALTDRVARRAATLSAEAGVWAALYGTTEEAAEKLVLQQTVATAAAKAALKTMPLPQR